MSEKKYKRKYEIQRDIVEKQSKYIEDLKSKIEYLELECKHKDELIDSVKHLRQELIDSVDEVKQKKNEYKELIEELKLMKNIIDQDVYKGRWWLMKFLLK